MRASRLLTIAAAGALASPPAAAGRLSTPAWRRQQRRQKTSWSRAVSAQPDQFDPHKTSAYPSFQVLENVYDTLVVPNAENLKMEPSLATKWRPAPTT